MNLPAACAEIRAEKNSLKRNGLTEKKSLTGGSVATHHAHLNTIVDLRPGLGQVWTRS